jgi:uncharacterized protein YggT (Ycf19 family)
MIPQVGLTFIDLFVTVFSTLILVRVIASYVAKPGGAFYDWITGITEPVLAPVRLVLPKNPALDLAPIVTFFLMQGLQYLAHTI